MKEARALGAGEAGDQKSDRSVSATPARSAQAHKKLAELIRAEVEHALDQANGYRYGEYGSHALELCEDIALILRRRIPALQSLSVLEIEALITDTLRDEIEDAFRVVGFSASEYVLDDVRDRLDLMFDSGEEP